MASKRETLLEYLIDLLQTITVAGGYNNDVKTVQRGIRGLRELGQDAIPAVFVTMTHEKRKRITQTQYDCALQVLLVGYVNNTKGDLDEASGTGVELDLDKFIQDVGKCIENDPLQKDQSGNARVYDTEITDIASDDGDLFPTAGFVMSVVFKYATEGRNP